MSTVAVMSVVLNGERSGADAPGLIERVVEFHDTYTATASASAGPTRATDATGFIVRGITGNTLVRVRGTAEQPSDTADQYLVLPNDSIYIKAGPGDALSLIELA